MTSILANTRTVKRILKPSVIHLVSRSNLIKRTMAEQKLADDARVVTVEHDSNRSCFIASIPDCSDHATLSYEMLGEDVIDLLHTEVPESHRGRGIGKVLARTAMDHAVENKLKMKLTCWYLKLYNEKYALPKHKEAVLTTEL